MTDPYVYPGTTVLKNKRGLRDEAALERFERLYTRQRLTEPLPAIEMSPAGYQALHRHLFQDVYGWAGEYRTVNIAKRQLFCLAPFIEQEMNRLFHRLNSENNLQGFDRQSFADRAAHYIIELNAIHPFREGNGRTNRLFLEALGKQTGHPFAIDRIQPAPWLQASIAGFDGEDEPMCQVIEEALD